MKFKLTPWVLSIALLLFLGCSKDPKVDDGGHGEGLVDASATEGIHNGDSNADTNTDARPPDLDGTVDMLPPDVGLPHDLSFTNDLIHPFDAAPVIELGSVRLDLDPVDVGSIDLPPLPPKGKPLDILVVVDNSGTMALNQARLVSQFPLLLDGLRRHALGPDGSGKPCEVDDTSGCNTPDLHIGIVSTDLGSGPYSGARYGCSPGGDNGELQAIPRTSGCTAPTDNWIAYDGSASNIPAGADHPLDRVIEAFSCIATLGTDGCGFEQPFESARRALDPTLMINPGFMRPEALLIVLFITDEDDCSARRVALYDPDPNLDVLLGPLRSFRCFRQGIHCDQDA
ncbi:MAG: hypothetical protein JRH20_16570, partial [Deltaproteobacteria bacterium]|nr:hypothetical protein [Deltaproteobacteria bacterium]